MPYRRADVQWQGTIDEGTGTLNTESGALAGVQYTTKGRFETDSGTTPEELIAAAHAGCFAMALAGQLTRAGFTPTSLNASARVDMRRDDSGFKITGVHLSVEGDVPNIEEAKFLELANGAKDGCPVSGALSALEITLDASLKQ